MEVRQAVAIAKQYLSELYADEGISNLGLEGVQFDDDQGAWLVTLGFSRDWENPQRSLLPPQRTYKVVELSDSTGEIVSVKHLTTLAA